MSHSNKRIKVLKISKEIDDYIDDIIRSEKIVCDGYYEINWKDVPITDKAHIASLFLIEDDLCYGDLFANENLIDSIRRFLDSDDEHSMLDMSEDLLDRIVNYYAERTLNIVIERLVAVWQEDRLEEQQEHN